MKKFFCTCGTIFALVFPFAVSASTVSYLCTFPTESSPSGLKEQKNPLELNFIVDEKTAKAYLLGNAGSAEVSMIQNKYGISFIEVTSSGNVMVTAITDNGDAVHSRNGIIFKKLTPSQYYGRCTAK